MEMTPLGYGQDAATLSADTRTPIPSVTEYCAWVRLSCATAVTSQVLSEHSELPVVAPAMPNDCPAWMLHPLSWALLGSSWLLRIGCALTQVGVGVSWTVISALPSPLTSTHLVLGVPPLQLALPFRMMAA